MWKLRILTESHVGLDYGWPETGANYNTYKEQNQEQWPQKEKLLNI